MRVFIFALFVATCYAGEPLDKLLLEDKLVLGGKLGLDKLDGKLDGKLGGKLVGKLNAKLVLEDKLPPAVITKKVVLPQKTVTVQRDIPVKSAPRLVTMTRPVPTIPNMKIIDKKIPVPSHPKIVTVNKHVPVKTQVVVPRPIPSPPRIITIERPVPVPQTVIVDKPYLVPTPVIIPRPVPVLVSNKADLQKRKPINLQPIIAAGPLSKPLPTPLAAAQSLVTVAAPKDLLLSKGWNKDLILDDLVLDKKVVKKGKLDLDLKGGKLDLMGKLGILGAPLAADGSLLLKGDKL